MTIPKFAEKYISQVKTQTVRSAIKKEHQNLILLEAIIREKQIGAYKVSIVNPEITKNYLLMMKPENPINIKDVIEKLSLKEDKVINFIKENEELLLEDGILDEIKNIKNIPKFIAKLFERIEEQ